MPELGQLADETDSALPILKQWIEESERSCELLPPSPERDATLLAAQVSTRSLLGTMAYHTGVLLLDKGWLRLLGSGHPHLTRTLATWNHERVDGFYLFGDDALGGFFALDGGALGPSSGGVFYLAPDSLQWENLDVGHADFVRWALSERLDQFYEDLRWPTWLEDLASLHGDRCFSFYPPLWTKGGSVTGSSRSDVPIAEAWELIRSVRSQ